MTRRQNLLPSLLLLCLWLATAARAGNYAEYLDAIEKRNQQLHSDYLAGLAPGRSSYLEDLDGHVSDVQAKHYVRDSAYPAGFDADRYWEDLLSRAEPEPGAAVRETRGGGDTADFADVPAASATDDLPPMDALAMAELIGQHPMSPDRREEEPYLNRLWGSMKVSGGAGEPGQVTGPANKPQKAKVMTNSLPSYCDPPNPCPMNADPKKLTSPCDKDVQDTAEFNYADTIRKLSTQQCPCDNEHMECPAGSTSVTSKKASQMGGRVNPYLRGNKRDKLDSKKSPKLSMHKRGVHANFHSQVLEKKNPWLDGVDALDTVEKKAGRHVSLEEPLSE